MLHALTTSGFPQEIDSSGWLEIVADGAAFVFLGVGGYVSCGGTETPLRWN